jgi:hypothetical protein
MTDTNHALQDTPVPVRLKLAALWTSVMFLYVYVDIFNFFRPGTVSDILDGRVWEFDITQGWMFGALVLMSIPSLMMTMSLLLPARSARWTNVVVGALYIPVSAFNVIGEAWAHYYLGAALEVALLLLVVRYAWTWPREG